MAKNYFLYARKSTDTEERQVRSIEDQLAVLKELAQKENLHIKQIFQETRTAKEPGRPIFNEMMSRMEKGEAQGIIAWHPDRLARNSIDGGRIIYLVDKGFINALKFPTFWFEDTPQGKFMLNIAFGQSKYYVDNLSENILRALRQKVLRGEWPHSRAPRGYIIDRNLKKIFIDPQAGPLVKKLFELYATGEHTLTDMQEMVCEWGLKGPSGKILVVSSIQDILKNTFYYGLMKYTGEFYPGIHEPLITKELYDQVQLAMKKNGKPNKHRKHSYVFLGLAKCATCGGSFTAERQRGHVYYRCTKKMKKPCHEPYVREEDLAKQISQVISNVALPQFAYDVLFNEINQKEKENEQKLSEQKTSFNNQIQDIKKKLSQLLDLHMEKVIDLEEYQNKKEMYLKQKITLEEKNQKLNKDPKFWLVNRPIGSRPHSSSSENFKFSANAI